ncbi:MAG: glycosyltransferase family 4 protein [Reyranellaceae bacterium]
MKVLHLSTFDIGSGAARGSQWLHEALRRRGIESTVMVASKASADDTVRLVPGAVPQLAAKLRMQFDSLPLRFYRRTEESFWSLGWLPCRFDRLIEAVDPDIIHLHWVGAGYLPVASLKHFSRPIVWTLRDMWSFTGGCHYTAGCERYRDGCGACPQLRSSNAEDLSRVLWRHKEKSWRGLDLWLVPISRWLGECVAASSILGRYPSEIIPNGLDVSTFAPTAKALARERWKLPLDRPVAVYGAINATRDPRKGFAELLGALRILGRSERTRNMLLVVFGDLQHGDVPDCGIETRYVGYVGDNGRLAELYASADVAVMPSLQEAFGKTIIEAMACGTPVVAFNSGGPRDIVSHGVDGYLAKPFLPEDLANGLVWCLERIAAGDNLGLAARAKVMAKFDIEVVADRYEALYEAVLAGDAAAAAGRAKLAAAAADYQDSRTA